MKGFTKIALIVALVFVVLGTVCCAVSLGTGFDFSEFKEDVDAGEYSVGFLNFPFFGTNPRFNWDDDQEEWQASSGDTFSFECNDIDSLEMDVYYGDVNIARSDRDNIIVDVEYRKENSKRQVDVSADGKTLVIKETGSKKSRHNDSTRITITIPKEKTLQEWKEIDVSQAAGNVYIDTPLTAKVIEVEVDAGECLAYHKLMASKELSIEVGAGNMELGELEAKIIEMDAGVGSLTTGEIIAEDIDITCGIGSITTSASGLETDYSYDIECGVGNVEIGKNKYSFSSFVSEDSRTGSRKMNIECGIGEVQVRFTGQKTEDVIDDEDIDDEDTTEDVTDNGVTHHEEDVTGYGEHYDEHDSHE